MTPQEVINDNQAVLTNAVEFAAEIITSIAGNDIANTVNGKPLSDAALKTAVASRMHAKLTPFVRA